MQEPNVTVHVTDKQLSAAAAGIKLTEIERSIEALEGLYRRKKTAAVDFTEACKAAAEKAGIAPVVLASFIAARVSEKFQDKKEQSDQLNLLFSEVGE